MKRSKRLKVIFLAAALVILSTLAACGGSAPSPSDPSPAAPSGGGTAEADKQRELVFLSPNQGNPYWATVGKGVLETSEALGANVTIYDAQDDPAKQVSQAEDALLKGVDALLISPFETDTGTAVAELANAAGVPVYILDCGCDAPYNGFVISDNVQGGRLAAEFLIEKAGKDMNAAEIQGLIGRVFPALRGVGFNEVMTEQKIPVKFCQPADFNRAKGMAIMENYLTQDKTLNAIFCWNDEMALGAKEAIAANGLTEKICLVGFDATEEACQAVLDGQMAATVAQNPYGFGKTGVEMAFKEFAGEAYEKDVLIECVLVTAENAKEFIGK